MPQSREVLPSPMSRRAASRRSTVGCSLKFAGISVRRFASAFSFSSGKAVFAGRRHSTPKYGAQSTRSLGLRP